MRARLSDIGARGVPNSIGFLRYALAALVVFSHSYPLGGLGPDPLQGFSGGQTSFGEVAVDGFFVLSGFLVTRSYVTGGSLKVYLWHRFLRIFPGFWACLLVTAWGFAPLVCLLERGGLRGWLWPQHDSPLGYVVQNSLLPMRQMEIAGLLGQVPHRWAFNGSLWTLEYEFRCYIGVAVLGVLGLLGGRRAVGRAVVAALLGLLLIVNSPGHPLGGPDFLLANHRTVLLSLWFCAGVLGYLCAGLVPVHGALCLAAAAVLLLGLRYGAYTIVGPLALGYVLFWLALRLPLSFWDRPGDFSYGLYIYAFPVQQVLALLGVPRRGVAVYGLLSLLLATALGVMSYKLVERPALRFKGLLSRG